MKVLVLGGTGLVGRQVVDLLEGRGHEAVPASPSTGVDAVTGAGLDEALAGVDAVVDVTNAPAWEQDAVVAFFTASTRNVLDAAKRAGAGHHVALSIVGVDRFPARGYMAGKIAQEKLIRDSGMPHTIVRATQFFEFLTPIADAGTTDGVARLTHHLMQPVAASDVARAVADAALAPAADAVVEIAGPERASLDELVARVLAARGDGRRVVADPEADYFGLAVDDTSLVPLRAARIGDVTLEEWLARTA
jgi:uncharacterized protein YbjT (DUF2867 family)